jgi:4-hydroxybenzoate polyprenyltransferase
MIVKEIFISSRPQQWIKNLFIFAAIIFSQNILNFSLLGKTIIAFISFCLLSSSFYIFNDLQDLEEDKRHPLKSKRPLASGRLKKSHALLSFGVLGFLGLILAASLNWPFLLISLIFFFLQVAYSHLQHASGPFPGFEQKKA